mmetsp:Transcript_22412/g.26438  ORF Transcript_22412/g.26438 Transcript_22412/m.26438 type:complete len:1465 (-) Transcript_22412:205-4599(-)
MPLHRIPKCASSQTARLDQLRADRAVEGLRPYLAQYDCFPEGRDPKSSPIREEELKELVKHWKLHRQRNFWRENTTKDDLVHVLESHVQHLREQEKRRAKFRAEMDNQVTPITPREDELSGAGEPSGGVVVKRDEDDPDLDTTLLRMRVALPLLAMIKKGSDLTELPDECLLYMSRVGMVGAGKINPALHMEGGSRAGRTVVTESDENTRDGKDGASLQGGSVSILGGSGGGSGNGGINGINSGSKEKNARKQTLLKRNLAAGLGNVSYREPSAVLGQSSAIKSLLELARDPDDEVVYISSVALLNLTLTPNDRAQLLKSSGAVFVLFDLTMHSLIDVRENAAKTLSRLSMDPSAQVPLVGNSAHVVLKEMFKQSNRSIDTAALVGIVNLASVPGATVADVVIETLMKLSTDDDEDIGQLVCEAMLNLSILSCSRASIVDVGAMTVLANLLSHEPVGADAHACVAQALCNLSTMRVNQGDMMREGVVRMVAELVEAEPPLVVLQYCAETIAYHACNHGRHEEMVSQGAVPAMVQVAGVDGIGLATNMSISCALAHLTSTYECCPQIVKQLALPVLITLLDEDELVVKKDAVTALCNLLVHPDTKVATIESGVITALVGLSQASDVTLNQVCAMALFNLSCSTEIHETILEQGGVQAIITLLSASANQEVVANCIKAMCNLSVGDDAQGQIIKGRGVPVIVSVASRDSTPLAVRKLVASTLLNLSNLPEGRQSMVSDDAVRCAIELSSIPSKNTRFACAGCLMNLAVVEDALDSGLVPALKDLAKTDDVATLLRVSTAFAFLSSQKKARGAMCAEPGMSMVLNSMMRSGHEDTQVESATCLTNMTTLADWEWGKCCLDDFIVIALLRTNSERTKLLCTKVLFNVLVDPNTRASMINKGVLYALMRISQLHNVYIHQICVQAVFNLSCQKSMHPSLHDNQVAPMLSAMTRVAQRVSMRVDLANALANLSSEGGHEHQLVTEGGLSVFKQLIKQPDINTKLALVRFLANVSTSTSVLALLVADAEVLDGLLKLVKSDVEALLNRACLALCNITCAVAAHKSLTDGGTIETLVEVLSKTDNARTIKLSVKALRNMLVCNPLLSARLLDANGIPVMVKHMTDPQDMETCSHCAKVCFVVATVPVDDLIGRLVDGGILEGLKAMSTVLNDVTAKAETLVALCNVSRCENKHAAIVKSGIVQAVCNLALSGQTSDSAFQFNIAATLRNLTTAEENHATIVRTPGAVKLLVESAKAQDVATREHIAVALHNLCVARDGSGRSAVGKQGGLEVLVTLSEGGSPRMRTFCGLALQSLSSSSPASSPAMAGRLVACMLAIKDVDEDEPKRIVEANTGGNTSSGALLPGRTACCWDDEPEPTWSHHVESLLDLPSLPAIDPSAASESDPAAAVEKPRARMLPHDEPELIAGSFTTMMASTQRVLPDPSFLRSRNEPDSPNTPGAPKLPALKGAIKN